MSFYTASSVKKELDANKILSIEGGLHCPQDQSWTQEGNTKCCGNSQSCVHVQNEMRDCKQRIHVSEKNGVKLTVLTFYFTISKTNLDGFIDEKDKQLTRLARNERYLVNTGAFIKFD